MKKLFLAALLISSLSSTAQNLEGEWKGAYILNAHVEKITAYIHKVDQGYSIKLDAPDRSVFDLDYDLSKNKDSVVFSRNNSSGNLFEFNGVISANTLKGHVVLHSQYMKDKPGIFQLMKSENIIFRGSDAPQFELTTMNEEVVTNEQFSDTYYMLDFWATWCKPCVAKRPKLEALKEKLGDRLQIISISLDENEAIVNDFREDRYPMNWAHVLKEKKWEDPFIDQYVKERLPYGYLIDKSGKVVAFGKELNAENFEETIARIFP